jgi:glycerol-3-phosphate dehydrogenase subunit C
MLSTGEWRPARERARRLVEALSAEIGEVTGIVASSTSCGLTLKGKYAAYLDMSDDGTTRIASALSDICQFIRDGRHRTALPSHPVQLNVLYHPPCQLRAHGVGFPALELLQTIPKLHVTLSGSACCGIGGTYGYDREKHDISTSISETLREQAAQLRPDIIACDSETCRWHLQSITGIRAVHPVQLVDSGSDADAPPADSLAI